MGGSPAENLYLQTSVEQSDPGNNTSSGGDQLHRLPPAPCRSSMKAGVMNGGAPDGHLAPSHPIFPECTNLKIRTSTGFKGCERHDSDKASSLLLGSSAPLRRQHEPPLPQSGPSQILSKSKYQMFEL